MPLLFGKKIGKQKIYISAINGPSLPPKHLKTGVGPSVVQSCHSLSLLFGGKKENRKICISIINGPSLPPQTLSNCQTPSKLSQVLRSLPQTWHLWIDCSADGNIRLTRRNVNRTQPALASSDATRYTKLPSSDRMGNQPTLQTRSSCSQGSRFLRLNIQWSFPNEVLANENL